jgi:hypothetical protein
MKLGSVAVLLAVACKEKERPGPQAFQLSSKLIYFVNQYLLLQVYLTFMWQTQGSVGLVSINLSHVKYSSLQCQ